MIKDLENIQFISKEVPQKYKIALLLAIEKLVAQSKKPFGLLVILGWQEKWTDEHYLLTDARQNIFSTKPVELVHKTPNSIAKILRKTKKFDGAILIRKDGTICDSGVYLTGLEPGLLLQSLDIEKTGDLSTLLGFREPVHSRHTIAITASWQMKDTTVYTVSEENNNIRIYEDGRIIYSTISEEQWSGF